MPVSDYHSISDVLHAIDAIKPKTMLDVGVGFGKWGVLCREILDIYNDRYKPNSWQIHIEGVEIFEDYRNPIWDAVYDQVHLCDVELLLDKKKNEKLRYDLILCCDVIEHFEKDVGKRILEKMLQSSNVVIIVTPNGYLPQGTVLGNPHEEHKSSWDKNDFKNMPHLYKLMGQTFMCVLASDPKSLKKIKLLNITNLS